MLPEGWRRSTLGEIARITSGGTPDRAEPSYWGGSVPWVTTGEIQFNTITDTAEKITEAGLENSSAKLFPPGTLLMAMYGQGKTRGQVAKLAIEASTNQNSAAIQLHEGHDPDFYFQYLWWKYDEIREFGHSGGISHLNAGLLKQIAVPVAPLDEQRRIARMLKTWDDAISLADRLTQSAKALSGSLIRRAFAVDVFGGNWPSVPLADVATCSVSNVDKKSLVGERSIRLCNYTDVYYSNRIDSSMPFMAATASEKEIAKFALQVGDVVITKDSETASDIAVAARVTEPVDQLICGYHLALIRPKREYINAEYLHAYFGLPRTRDYFSASASGVTRFGLSTQAIQDAPVPIAPLDLQYRIADLVLSGEDLLRRCRDRAAVLRVEKAALMAELLAGKRRVRLPAAETAP